MIEAGIVPEILGTMRDEIAGPVELDIVGKRRLVATGFELLKKLAATDEHSRSTIIGDGAEQQILAAIIDDEAHGDHEAHGFGEMQHDIHGQGCDLLATLGATRETL